MKKEKQLLNVLASAISFQCDKDKMSRIDVVFEVGIALLYLIFSKRKKEKKNKHMNKDENNGQSQFSDCLDYEKERKEQGETSKLIYESSQRSYDWYGGCDKQNDEKQNGVGVDTQFRANCIYHIPEESTSTGGLKMTDFLNSVCISIHLDPTT